MNKYGIFRNEEMNGMNRAEEGVMEWGRKKGRGRRTGRGRG